MLYTLFGKFMTFKNNVKKQYSHTGHGWQNGDCVFHVGYL